MVINLKERVRRVKKSIKDNKELVAILAIGTVITGAILVTKPDGKPHEHELREIDVKLRNILDREPDWTGGEDELYAGEEYGYYNR